MLKAFQVLVFFALFANPVFSQGEHRVGATIGYGIAQISSGLVDFEATGNRFAGGVMYTYQNADEKLPRLKVRLEYETNEMEDAGRVVEINRFTFTPLFNLQVNPDNRLTLQFDFGPVVGLVTKNSLDLTGEGFLEETPTYNQPSLGATVGLGLEYEVVKGVGALVEAHYVQDFTDAFKASGDDDVFRSLPLAFVGRVGVLVSLERFRSKPEKGN